jgi:uracil-DNA glycosylase
MDLIGYPPILATIHPSSILRAQDEEGRKQERAAFVADLIKAAKVLDSLV